MLIDCCCIKIDFFIHCSCSTSGTLEMRVGVNNERSFADHQTLSIYVAYPSSLLPRSLLICSFLLRTITQIDIRPVFSPRLLSSLITFRVTWRILKIAQYLTRSTSPARHIIYSLLDGCVEAELSWLHLIVFVFLSFPPSSSLYIRFHSLVIALTLIADS